MIRKMGPLLAQRPCPMNELTGLPNIGSVAARQLEAAKIHTPQELLELGAREAFLRIRRTVDDGACLHLLYALQGAVEGKRYPLLSEETKNGLRRFFQEVTKEG